MQTGNAFDQQGELACAAADAGLSGIIAVPGPATLSMLAFGAVGLMARRRRHR